MFRGTVTAIDRVEARFAADEAAHEVIRRNGPWGRVGGGAGTAFGHVNVARAQ
jgi:hypothetical protein